jgi:hypothetical protein
MGIRKLRNMRSAGPSTSSATKQDGSVHASPRCDSSEGADDGLQAFNTTPIGECSFGEMAMRRILFTIAVLAVLQGLAPPAPAIDLDELTVVTLARDGSWGVATAASQGPAIAAAVRDCRAMAASSSDCGAQFATTRGGWVVAKLCGDHKIIVAAETREAAEQAALARELSLKRLVACTRVLTVNPGGMVIPRLAALIASRREAP